MSTHVNLDENGLSSVCQEDPTLFGENKIRGASPSIRKGRDELASVNR